VGRGQCVALLMERSAAAIVAMLGVLKIGATYMAIDPVSPAARMELLLGDAAPAAVITSAALRPRLDAFDVNVIDIDEAQGYGFPLFARSRTPRTARGRIVETGTNVPITVADIAVSPGDFVVADGTGVVFVSARDIEAVLEAAEAIAARERAMVAALNEGQPVTQVMGKSYETMLKR